MVNPKNVFETLKKNMLVDGFPIVMDLEKSHGNTLVDAITGDEYKDFFSGFASIPLGYNHPKMLEPAFLEKLKKVAITKVTNSDIYTSELAEAVKTFNEVGIPKYLSHLFFVSGGALAVENALKTAFDWKIRRNWEKGVSKDKELGKQVIHFREAFHGRSGYTMSLTNTDPVKVALFPKFDWPRIDNPKITFPLDDHLDEVLKAEEKAIDQINTAIKKNGKDIAAIILEPIQGEGGDNHFRVEFLEMLREIADENDILLIFDEVQTGVGITGEFWAHQNYGVEPDIMSFGKKTQICGILAGKRIDEVKDNVFQKSSRINSTWGGNLVDAVRFSQYLKVIRDEKLVANAKTVGAYLLEQLKNLQEENPNVISNARGLGLFAAIDFPDGEKRDKFRNKLLEKRQIFLGCGHKAIRFRPFLDTTKEQVDECLNTWKEILKKFK
ncbi:MAG: L-lysine 6-transaminase [Acidobacteria bacterium]|nr:L-lysine 6-transaminase [Acidobacteriota bacterium]